MLLSLFSRYGAGQLKVMFVGGPNVRKDYHIDEGEEVTKFNCSEKHAQRRCFVLVPSKKANNMRFLFFVKIKQMSVTQSIGLSFIH